MAFDIPSDSEDEELPDWLKALQGDDLGAPEEGNFLQPEQEDAPDWLSGMASQGEEIPAAGQDVEDGPAWLDNIRQSEDSVGLPASEEEDGQEDWLLGIREREGGELGDDLIEDSGATENFMDRIHEIQAGEENDAPDWASRFEADADQEVSFDASPEGSEEDDSEGSPDWLSGLGGDSPAQEPAPVDDTPDWLGALSGGEDEPALASSAFLDDGGSIESEDSPAVEGDAGDAPDWLSSMLGDESPLPGEPSGEAPEWLGSIQSDEQDGDDTALAEELQESAEKVDSGFPGLPGIPGGKTGTLPGWLVDLEESSPDLAGIGPEEEVALPSPAALSDFEEEEEFSLEPADLPSWLSDAAERQIGDAAQTGDAALDTDEDVEEIASAEMPNWLQAMRPVEAVGPGGGVESGLPKIRESVGPLAGLSNVLPAEPDIVHFGMPPEHSIHLEVTQSQQKYIALLKSLASEEEEIAPVKRRAVALPQQILRWIIAALLYLIVFIPVFMGSQNTPMPNPAFMPEESVALYDLISALSPNAPVLVAIEYQPGLSGEMEAAASGVIDDIIIHGANLVLMSTRPTGPGLGEHFLQTRLNDHTYVTEHGYTNLGFVSGGAAALLNFATDPVGTFPIQLEDGTSAWTVPPLVGISNIRDFALVVVITDDPDTARGWIEQVQPALVNPLDPNIGTPMVMVVSAQAEPLVYPYYETSPRQVKGLVSGLSGGAYYESRIRPRLARKYWDGFGAGLTVTVALLIIGGGYSLSRSLLALRRD